MTYSYEWDETKHVRNRRKHGVSFFEARELLESDTERVDYYDHHHSDHEDRFITVGPVRRGLLAVIWTFRGDDRIRIITARFARPYEEARFHERPRR